jgi:hypothetical protein
MPHGHRLSQTLTGVVFTASDRRRRRVSPPRDERMDAVEPGEYPEQNRSGAPDLWSPELPPANSTAAASSVQTAKFEYS